MAAEPRELADRQHATLVARDDATRAALAEHYAANYRAIGAEIEALRKKAQDVRDSNGEARPSWLYEQQRLAKLREQIAAELRGYGVIAADIIRDSQRAEALRGGGDAVALMRSGVDDVLIDFARLNPRAIDAVVGRTLHDGAPLAKTLARLPDDGAVKATDILVRSVTLGYGPDQTARLLRQQLGGNLGQYMTIARTEIVGAYREGNLQTYRANEDLLAGWEWLTAEDELVCPFCAGMAGSVHDVGEDMITHPNCRCTCIPKLKGA